MENELRRPTPPPRAPVPYVGRDAELRALERELLSRSGSGSAKRVGPNGPAEALGSLLVLHGPPGVGKSVLAATLATRWIQGQAHWLALDERAESIDAATPMLRLSAESGAPRKPMAEALLQAMRPPDTDGALTEAVRSQFADRLGGTLIVLDGALPQACRELVAALGKVGADVIVTSRQRSGWDGTGAHLHEVEPLDTDHATALAGQVTLTGPREPSHVAHCLPELVTAACGLPPWLRIAGALLRGSPAPHLPDSMGPDDLLGCVLARLTPEEELVLGRLAACPPGEISLREADALALRTDAEASSTQDVLSALVSHELLQVVRDGVFSLSAPVAEAVRQRLKPDRLNLFTTYAATIRRRLALKDIRDAAVRLSGETFGESTGARQPEEPLSPADLAASVDRSLALLNGPLAPEYARQIADRLACVLAAHGDIHRLVALDGLAVGSTAVVRGALAAVVRELGLAAEAGELLASGTVHHHEYQREALQYESGRLVDNILRQRAPELLTDSERAWVALVDGARLCDRGRPWEAEAMLLDADARHRILGCHRGHGWSLLHMARANLLLHRTNKAGHLLSQAHQVLRRIGDVRGAAWVATEQSRLLLLEGGIEAAVARTRTALTAHSTTEDVRGTAWTCHHLGLVHMADGQPDLAKVVLLSALRHFQACGDALGTAWTRHRLALLGVTGRDFVFSTIAREFAAIGCVQGRAWSLLEMTLRTADHEERAVQLGTARDLFRQLDDQGGLQWVETVRSALSEGAVGAESRTPSLPLDTYAFGQVLADHEEFWRTYDRTGRCVIPFGARSVVAVPGRSTEEERLAPAPVTSARTSGCHVRVTLLDESPTAGTSTRLLLCVIPDEDHIWASAPQGPPWLSAAAVPLTRASVEPATALLRPSQRAAHGAAFSFTAHSPGFHRIRFTITLEGTGAVLQQVETELDILDADQPGGRAAPRATTLRGR